MVCLDPDPQSDPNDPDSPKADVVDNYVPDPFREHSFFDFNLDGDCRGGQETKLVGNNGHSSGYESDYAGISGIFKDGRNSSAVRYDADFSWSADGIISIMENKKHFESEEAKAVGDGLDVDWKKFDVEQFRAGMDVELEHGLRDPHTDVTGDDSATTGKIALAHLNEFPDYYTRLSKMEEEAEEYWENK